MPPARSTNVSFMFNEFRSLESKSHASDHPPLFPLPFFSSCGPASGSQQAPYQLLQRLCCLLWMVRSRQNTRPFNLCSRLHEASVHPSISGSEQDSRGTSREVNLTLEGAGDSAVVCVPQQKYISDWAAKKKCLRQIKIPSSTF